MRRLIIFMSLLVTCWSLKEEQLTLANNRLGLQLLKALPSSTQENLFFSPYSVSSVMGMAFAGARGDTRHELSQGLGYATAGFQDSDILDAYALHTHRLRSLESNSTLEVANAAAVHERFALQSAYELQLAGSFTAMLLKVNFENGGRDAVDTINRWVKLRTHEKIPRLFNAPLESSTRLVLLSAIYFKGKWEKEFEKNDTEKRTFLNGGTIPTQVDTMTGLVPVRHQSFESLGVDMAELPYQGGDYSMVILLPKQNDGVEVFKQNLTDVLIKDMASQLVDRQVRVFLPRFKLETEYSLRNPLENLGIRRIFGPDADLSGITEDNDIQVSAVVHKAFVKSTFDVANAAAIHERLSLLSAYESTLDSTFHAQLLKVDFVNGGQAAMDEINRLVLLNAIFFKGVWSTKFDESATTKKQFLNGGTTPTQVDTMTKSIRIGYKSFPTMRLEVAELPYAGGNYNNLKNLGITEMFSAQADLSGITSDADLTVSDVVHKAVVEVNEEGTEAAAATGVVAVNRLSGVPSLEFNVNQPFLFFIRNTQTQDLLFAGQLNHL
ncbi:hypothetical protein HPB47_027198 [Ixodes persulcatus]|uniref:Uncharacterized protein n=1 Tax=Ixodes persulcatus TaxID=34615 RepID=A0AC60PWK2_IXOPE|nr:hypothetical protein HPB47_027198 [Ixodes persulcatus]